MEGPDLQPETIAEPLGTPKILRQGKWDKLEAKENEVGGLSEFPNPLSCWVFAPVND